ncbi:MAG: hypothetical protein KAR32_12635, partial [Candidatus Omnitrophica bacterium]|nr:hypothetical protein [Candidatus Omnitrophota bacterium]
HPVGVATGIVLGQAKYLKEKYNVRGLELVTFGMSDTEFKEALDLLHKMEGTLKFGFHHPMQIRRKQEGFHPLLSASKGENLEKLGDVFEVDSQEKEEMLIKAWMARAWIFSKLTPANNMFPTADNLLEMALALEDDGVSQDCIFGLGRNKYDDVGETPSEEMLVDRREFIKGLSDGDGVWGQLVREGWIDLITGNLATVNVRKAHPKASLSGIPDTLKEKILEGLHVTESEQMYRERFAALVETLTKVRVMSNMTWTTIGSKSTAMTGVDFDTKNRPHMKSMLIIDDKSTIVYGLEDFKEDRRYMRQNPNAVTRVARRTSQFPFTSMGEAIWMCEMGHKINMEGTQLLGGTAGEYIMTGWLNEVVVATGRAEEALRMGYPARVHSSRSPSNVYAKYFGVQPFIPGDYGISEDIGTSAKQAYIAMTTKGIGEVKKHVARRGGSRKTSTSSPIMTNNQSGLGAVTVFAALFVAANAALVAFNGVWVSVAILPVLIFAGLAAARALFARISRAINRVKEAREIVKEGLPLEEPVKINPAFPRAEETFRDRRAGAGNKEYIARTQEALKANSKQAPPAGTIKYPVS